MVVKAATHHVACIYAHPPPYRASMKRSRSFKISSSSCGTRSGLGGWVQKFLAESYSLARQVSHTMIGYDGENVEPTFHVPYTTVPFRALYAHYAGTGKTQLARAVAGEAGCKFYSKSASEFEEMLVGVCSVQCVVTEATSGCKEVLWHPPCNCVSRAYCCH